MQPQSEPIGDEERKEKTEQLINRYGSLVDELYASPVWKEVLGPLIEDSVKSVSGGLSNGIWHHGDFTGKSPHSLEYLSGYQTAVMELSNRLYDHVRERDNLRMRRLKEAQEKRSPLVGPMDEVYDA